MLPYRQDTLSAGSSTREHFRSACDIIASTRRWRRFGRMDGWIDVMARGHKTGGRQKGTPNKRKAECDAKFAEAIVTRDWAKTVGT